MIPKKILFCADFSDNSTPARQIAVDYAEAFGATLLLVHVVDEGSFRQYGDYVADPLDEVLKMAQESSLKRLEILAEESGSLKGGIQTICRVGTPAMEIASVAEEQAVDLIVMGTHGISGLKQLVMGSIARSVLKFAHRPVLIVEAPKQKGETYDEPYEYPAP